MNDKLDIEHIAKLSRLELTPEENEKYAKQMGGVLEYAEKIGDFRSSELSKGSSFGQSSATSGESFATPEESTVPVEVGIINGVTDVMREDEVEKSLPRNEALKNAPTQKDGFIQVKEVFAESEEN